MDDASTIPKFVVDLSLPPEIRYNHIIPHFQDSVAACNLPSLFDELLETVVGPRYGKVLATVARYTLRRVHSAEETAELTGISQAIGIPMHILVAFNVLLDLLLGCTSGGVRTLDPQSSKQATRMLHFRTLDWGMEQLRQIIVELDFVRFTGGPVIATTITYLGYVGVLTGVRKGLSMSLNFRPHHAQETSWQEFSFRWNQAMVVLGYRQSISSTLRNILLDASPDPDQQPRKSQETNIISSDSKVSDQYVQNVLTKLSTSNSTAAYLIFCQPNRTYIVEKDHRSANIRESDTFLTAYNHDVKDEEDPSRLQEAVATLADGEDVTGMADLVGLSLSRQHHLQGHWRKRVSACRRRYKQRSDVVTMSDVIGFLEHDEIGNLETHYAVIMDPEEGKVLWRRQYEVESDSDSEDSP
ncbi:uncharacterized protein FTOL_01648 [Fusarium torulosum]|uniref:ceramidase n=1 Tax=Fusarium torulosum TaxID=33205 RepID=A0AAE8M0L4_9HYPO|nr:uncharacterized protein FTOL_01648 [Fusarium torulosum]